MRDNSADIGMLMPAHALLLTLVLLVLFSMVYLLGPLGATAEPDKADGHASEVQLAVTGSLSPIFTPEIRYWNDSILRWAAENDLDPNLIATVMQIESCGDPQAVSPAGAQGLFQVMPFHFQSGDDMLDPDTNALRGLSYLKEGLDLAGGDVGRALAGYNGGHSIIDAGWVAWSAETRSYYIWGTGLYRDASSHVPNSPTLARWLAAGGSALCHRADGNLPMNSN